MQEYFGQKTSELATFSFNIIKQGILARHRIKPDSPIPLTTSPIPYLSDVYALQPGTGFHPSKGLILSTLRMGYGHHRIAYAVYSRAAARGKTTYLHDVLAIESPESNSIREIDQAYSFLSRLSSEWGGPLEWAWGVATSQGNLHSLHFSCLLAAELTNLISALPKEMPVVSAHPLNGQMAVAAGFKKIVNLIPDNHPQYYLLVPGALNLVQSAAQYAKYREWGVPAENLAVAGHWVSNDVARYAKKDAKKRIKRADRKAPRRLFLPIGGAGAQRSYVVDFMKALADRLREGSLRLIVNAGDHVGVFQAIEHFLERQKIPFRTIREWPDLMKYCHSHELDGQEIPESVTLCFFENYYEAFMATDHLIRVCDILLTKPSELAFYPVPKLFTRRVGDHEADAALRSQELGDGTTECREVKDAVAVTGLLSQSDDVFIQMNENIIRNTRAGVYAGCKLALDIALD